MTRTRREFLKTVGAAGVAASVPYIWTSSYARAQDANSKPKLASIGVGGSRGAYSRGGAVARQAAKFGDMVAVCDVDQLHTHEFNAKFDNKLKEYADYRKLLDEVKPEVVTIGTPDHWHVPIAIAALRSGADVYCEKPLTLTIDEGKQISQVVKETKKVFQVGTQQRSEYGKKFLKAIAFVQGGYLGDNVKAYVAIGGGPKGGPFENSKVPEELNWDFWVGPAQTVAYCQQRRKDFRWFLEYSGGKMTDWGAHHIDIAQWALGHSHSSPVEIRGTGTFPPTVPEKFDFAAYFAGKAQLPNAFNSATEFSIDLKFDNGAVLQVNHNYKSEDGQTSFGNGILFEGSKGRIFVNRGRLSGKPIEELSAADNQKLEEAIEKLYKGKALNGHMANFFDCVADRSDPVSDVYTHHRTMTSCHMCNIALMLGRELKYDPEKQQFLGDEQANALMKRPQRDMYL